MAVTPSMGFGAISPPGGPCQNKCMITVAIRSADHAYQYRPAPDGAPTLVFIHGWMLSRHYWQPLCDRLHDDYGYLTYDLRGFGDSGLGRTDSFSLQSYASDLVELVDALGLSKVWLVGHSMGGSIALWAADLAPAVVSGIMCVNAGGGIYIKDEFEKFRRFGTQLVKMRSPWMVWLPGLSWYFGRDSVFEPLAKRWGRQRVRDFLAAHPTAATGALLDTTTEGEVHLLPQVVARLQQPAIFIAGENDAIMEPKYVHHLASFHRDYGACGDNMVELERCGHLAMLEQSERVADILRQAIAAKFQVGSAS
ncbi:MAG: alpha/beta hydrolase [Cyanobacteria bacterium J06642_2]